MDPLLKRGKMRAWTATNVSEASGSSSRRFRPEVSGSRWNPSASEVSAPIPKWRSNASQSSRPHKRKYETAGIVQKFHRQEDNRQQTEREQCSTASNPLSDVEQLWFRDCHAKKREQEDKVRVLQKEIGHYSTMMRSLEEKSMRTLSETGTQDETGTHSTLPAAEAPTQTEAALKPWMQPPRQLQTTSRPPRSLAAIPPPPPPPPGRAGAASPAWQSHDRGRDRSRTPPDNRRRYPRRSTGRPPLGLKSLPDPARASQSESAVADQYIDGYKWNCLTSGSEDERGDASRPAAAGQSGV